MLVERRKRLVGPDRYGPPLKATERHGNVAIDSALCVRTSAAVISGASTVRQKWMGRLIEGLPASGGRVLDLGCGAGIPVACDLTALGHAVVGVDGSAQQVVRARRESRARCFSKQICAFDVGSFDAVGACYSITHIPPAQQGPLIANIAAWLKPGGRCQSKFSGCPGCVSVGA
jgi:SAM-dependent methyltransferase